MKMIEICVILAIGSIDSASLDWPSSTEVKIKCVWPMRVILALNSSNFPLKFKFIQILMLHNWFVFSFAYAWWLLNSGFQCLHLPRNSFWCWTAGSHNWCPSWFNWPGANEKENYQFSLFFPAFNLWTLFFIGFLFSRMIAVVMNTANVQMFISKNLAPNFRDAKFKAEEKI